MKSFINPRYFISHGLFVVMSLAMVWTLVSSGPGSREQSASASVSGKSSPEVVCPGGQCFTDVPSTNPFYGFTNALYLDSIISGYPCGGPGEPCDPESRPYYRPGNNVTRAQMSKFVDNGRRNIADATGTSLVISGTAYNTLDVKTNSAGSAIVGTCMTPSTACYA